jgi:predicted dienelactone hydrolase
MVRAMRAPLLLAISLAAGAGCSSERRTADYIAAGSHGVGFSTFTFVDGSRPTMANGDFTGAPNRTLVTEIWYPAKASEPTRDAPFDPAGGPFPMIVHSHGFDDGRLGEGYLGEHLASHGYIVVAPDYPLSKGGAPGGATVTDVPAQPLDLAFVIDQVLAGPAAPGGPLAGAIDPARIGVSGLSLGGLTALLAAYHPTLRDSRIKAVLPMAAPSCFLTPAFYTSTSMPLLLVHGDSDQIVPIDPNSARAFDRATEDPRELITLHRGSHTGFAGYASLFDPTMHYDRIGCLAVKGIDVTNFSALGSEAEGISSDPTVCPMPCTGTIEDPALNADRQHDLVDAIALAFFDAQFRADASAKHFLTGPLAAENTDLAIRLP